MISSMKSTIVAHSRSILDSEQKHSANTSKEKLSPVKNIYEEITAAQAKSLLEKPTAISKMCADQKGERAKSMKKEHILTQWTIRPLKSGDICVEGEKTVDGEDEMWHSTAIVKRLGPLRLATSSGAVYILKGSLDNEAAQFYGIPNTLATKFEKGFPSNWKVLCDEFLSKRKELKVKQRKVEPPTKKSSLEDDLTEDSPEDDLTEEDASFNQKDHEANDNKRESKHPHREEAYYNPDDVWRGESPRRKRQLNKEIEIKKEILDEKKPGRKKFRNSRSSRKSFQNSLSDPIDLTSVPTTRSGRKVLPVLAWWTGQRLSMQGGESILEPGTPNVLRCSDGVVVKSNEKELRKLERRLASVRQKRKQRRSRGASYVDSSTEKSCLGNSTADETTETEDKPKIASKESPKVGIQIRRSRRINRIDSDSEEGGERSFHKSEPRNKDATPATDDVFTSDHSSRTSRRTKNNHNKNRTLAKRRSFSRSKSAHENINKENKPSRSSSREEKVDKTRYNPLNSFARENMASHDTARRTRSSERVTKIQHHKQRNVDNSKKAMSVAKKSKSCSELSLHSQGQSKSKPDTKLRHQVQRNVHESSDSESVCSNNDLDHRLASESEDNSSHPEIHSEQKPVNNAIVNEDDVLTRSILHENHNLQSDINHMIGQRKRVGVYNQAIAQRHQSLASVNVNDIVSTKNRTDKHYLKKALTNSMNPTLQQKILEDSPVVIIQKPIGMSKNRVRKKINKKAPHVTPLVVSESESDVPNSSDDGDSDYVQVREKAARRSRKKPTMSMSKTVSKPNKSTLDRNHLGGMRTDPGQIRVWQEDEIGRFQKAVSDIPGHMSEYWDLIACVVKTRSAAECRAFQQAQRDVLKSAPSRRNHETSVLRPEEISGGVGTLKRKRQLRELIENHNKGCSDDLFDSTPYKKRAKNNQIAMIDQSDDEFFGAHSNNFQTPGVKTPAGYMPSSSKKTPGSFFSPGVFNSIDRNAVDQYMNRAKKGRRRFQTVNRGSDTSLKISGHSLQSRVGGFNSALFTLTEEAHPEDEEEQDFYFSDCD